MNFSLEAYLELRKVKSSLSREIEKLEYAIQMMLPNDPKLLDKIANEESLGVYDYRLCTSNEEKVLFAVRQLGKADLDTVSKFMFMLGDQLSIMQLKKIVRITTKLLYENKELKKEEVDGRTIYSLEINLGYKKSLTNARL